MPPVRLGAVGYLNARPLVYGLEGAREFALRFDVPSRCADLLHDGLIDVGLIPSIEYLRGPASAAYAVVPDLAIASHGPVASVAIFTTRPINEVRSIALDTSSRTSVALVRVLCARVFRIQPALESRGPDLSDMLAHCDAALIIGDKALLQAAGEVQLEPDPASASGLKAEGRSAASTGEDRPPSSVVVEKIDLGDVWTQATGLPFVYAFWAGRAGCLTAHDIGRLQQARDLGVQRPDEIAAEYFATSPQHLALGARYLRDNIKYALGAQERAGLELFFRWAAETGAVEQGGGLHFF